MTIDCLQTTYNSIYISDICRTLPKEIVIFHKVCRMLYPSNSSGQMLSYMILHVLHRLQKASRKTCIALPASSTKL